jgi:hypothetical protein
LTWCRIEVRTQPLNTAPSDRSHLSADPWRRGMSALRSTYIQVRSMTQNGVKKKVLEANPRESPHGVSTLLLLGSGGHTLRERLGESLPEGTDSRVVSSWFRELGSCRRSPADSCANSTQLDCRPALVSSVKGMYLKARA